MHLQGNSMNRQILQQSARKIAEQNQPKLSAYEFEKYTNNYVKNGLKNFTKDAKAYWNYLINSHKSSVLGCGNLINTFVSFPTGWSYEDDFTVDNSSNSGADIIVDTALTQITWEILRNGTNDSLSIDLIGGFISDSTWLLRLPIETTTLDTTPTKTMEGHFGISDFNNTRNASQTEDYMGMMLATEAGGAELYTATTKVAQTLNAGTGRTNFAHALAVEAVFAQIKRLTATTSSYGLSTTTAYDDDIEAETPIIDVATNSLRYFVIRNIFATGGGTLELVGKCNANLQFNDGVSTPP